MFECVGVLFAGDFTTVYTHRTSHDGSGGPGGGGSGEEEYPLASQGNARNAADSRRCRETTENNNNKRVRVTTRVFCAFNAITV